ncbi:MAG: MAPEG family protein, partial [Gammaproteobacteria bacterium]|nr:MAPEG family protein [Gammaproteobacteria bacterium]
MTFAYWSVLLAALLPLIWAGVAKTGAEGYDNHKPRVFLAELRGRAQRANWAQSNSYESFPPYAAAVIIASLVGGDQIIMDII